MSLQVSPILQNFVTKKVMTDGIPTDMLNIFAKGKEKYLAFRLPRFIQKSIKLSENIHRGNQETMDTLRKKPPKTIKKTVKEMNIAEKLLKLHEIMDSPPRIF